MHSQVTIFLTVAIPMDAMQEEQGQRDAAVRAVVGRAEENPQNPPVLMEENHGNILQCIMHSQVTIFFTVAIPMDAIQEEQGQRDEAVQAMVGRAEENPQNPPVLMEENHGNILQCIMHSQVTIFLTVAIPMDAMQEEQGRLDTAVQATVVHAEENSPVLTEVEIQADVVNGVEHGALHPAPEQEHAN